MSCLKCESRPSGSHELDFGSVLSVTDAESVIPPDIVTMHSQVIVEDLESHKRQKLTLCYPSDAEPHLGFISVLSPVGAILLRQRVGAVARWHTPNGGACATEIVSLLFQPEASGDYTTWPPHAVKHVPSRCAAGPCPACVWTSSVCGKLCWRRTRHRGMSCRGRTQVVQRISVTNSINTPRPRLIETHVRI